MEADERQTMPIIAKSNAFEYVLSSVIILCRAMQPGATPMEEWSVLSWILMTFPVTWPLFLFVITAVGGIVSGLMHFRNDD